MSMYTLTLTGEQVEVVRVALAVETDSLRRITGKTSDTLAEHLELVRQTTLAIDAQWREQCTRNAEQPK